MKTAPMVVAASLALAVGVLVAPGLAFAQLAQGFQTSGPVVGGATLGTSRSVAVPFQNSGPVVGGANLGISRSVAVPFPPQFFPLVRPFVRPFAPFAAVAAAPAVVYAAPPEYYPSPVYYPPPYYYGPQASYSAPVSYSPPASYAPAPSTVVSVPPVPPTPNVVQLATGRYELRGDGISTPHTWVWIPNPPTAPPSEEPTSRSQSAPRASRLFRWTDGQGVAHWTDRLDAVPEQYRERPKQTQPS